MKNLKNYQTINSLEKKTDIKNLSKSPDLKVSHPYLDSSEQFEFKNKLGKRTSSVPYEKKKKQKEYNYSTSAYNSPTFLRSRRSINFEHLFKKNMHSSSQKTSYQLNILWRHLLAELSAEFEIKENKEDLVNFLLVPKELEKVLLFGWLVCLDTVLF
ncbi:unnamed protein product [Pneumocystis jirovecii]|uniref:Uncharacterized protein n=1 Tax=Pneumocystis jirovecii TaxID=42068 RepID=L0P7S6_PNEJI|nr:unnamed protein product [Pneumocystis jirovecii]